MAVDQALTADEILALAGPSTVEPYVVWDTSDVDGIVATALINAPGGLTYPLTQIPVDNVSANWTDILAGMVFYVGSTSGGFDRGIYRVRQSGSLTTLETMAIDDLDSGIINIADRRLGIQDNDHITVLKSDDMFGVFPRIDYLGDGLDANIYEDWTIPYSNFNRYPPPIVNITIDGHASHFATHIYADTTYTFDIVVDFELWPTTTTIAWSILLPAGWTLNSGSLTGTALTQTINVTAPHSAGTYKLRVNVVEDHGQAFSALRNIWIKSFTYPPVPVVKVDNHVEDETGAKVTLTFNSILTRRPGAMMHFFKMCTWSGTDVPSASRSVTGYCIRQHESGTPGLASVTLDIVGPSYMMDLIGAQSQVMDATQGDPVVWQEVYYLLSYLDFIIWWIVASRMAGMVQMFNWTSFGLTNSEKRMSSWRIDTGTLLSQVQAQCKRYIGGNFGCDATGEVMLRRRYSMLRWDGVDERSGVPIRAALASNGFTTVDLDSEERPQVRHIRAEAFISDTITDTPEWSDAPQIPGQGQREEKMERLIVDATDEFYEGAGNGYASRNNPHPNGSVLVKKNWAVIKPAQQLPLDLTINAVNRYDRVDWNNLVAPSSVQYIYNPDGTVHTKIGFAEVTAGLPGKFAEIPVPDPTTYNSFYQSIPFTPVPAWRSNNPNPAGTRAGAKPKPANNTGGLSFVVTAHAVYLAINIYGTIRYRNITPPSLGSYLFKHGTVAVGTNRAYVVGNDGTNSKVWSCPDVTATVPVWTASSAISGACTLVRTTAVAGTVLIYSPNGVSVTTNYNFLTSDGGFTAVTPASGSPATWVSGTGWVAGDAKYGTNYYRNVYIEKLISAANVVGTTHTYNLTIGAYAVSTDGEVGVFFNGVVDPGYLTGADVVNGSGQVFPWTGSNPGITSVQFVVASSDQSSAIYSGAAVITAATITTDAGGGGAEVRVSTDYGATFGSPVSVGTSPGLAGGFDISRTGSTQKAAALSQVKTASTFGGAFSNASDGAFTALNLLIPWYQRNANTTPNTSEYIFGMATAVAAKSLYWVVGGTKVDITPTFGGNPGLSIGANDCTTWKGTHIAKLAEFGGTTKLAINKTGGTIANWVDKGAQSGATIARVKRLSSTPGILAIAGASILKISQDFGTTLTSKALPSSEPILAWEFLG